MREVFPVGKIIVNSQVKMVVCVRVGVLVLVSEVIVSR